QHRAPHSRRRGVLLGRRAAPTVGRHRPSAAGGAADARDHAYPADEIRCADHALGPRQRPPAGEFWCRGPPHRDSWECRAGPGPDGPPEYFCVRSHLHRGPGLSARGGGVTRAEANRGGQRHRAPVPAPAEGTRGPQSAQERAICASRRTVAGGGSQRVIESSNCLRGLRTVHASPQRWNTTFAETVVIDMLGLFVLSNVVVSRKPATCIFCRSTAHQGHYVAHPKNAPDTVGEPPSKF